MAKLAVRNMAVSADAGNVRGSIGSHCPPLLAASCRGLRVLALARAGARPTIRFTCRDAGSSKAQQSTQSAGGAARLHLLGGGCGGGRPGGGAGGEGGGDRPPPLSALRRGGRRRRC